MNVITFSNPEAVRVLTTEDFQSVARALSVEEAAVRAVAKVESSGAAFLPDGRPTILYEAHIFHRMTNGRYATALDHRGTPISVPNWNRTLYGPTGDHQYQRLNAAMALDVDAALSACSWGAFQIMGMNFVACGFASVRDFVQAHVDGIAGHLTAFGNFVKSKGLDRALRSRDWTAFARGYNGPGFAQNQYDAKMAAAFDRWSGGAAEAGPSPIAQAQAKLGLVADGIAGPRTRAAVIKFQQDNGLAPDGVLGPATLKALGIG